MKMTCYCSPLLSDVLQGQNAQSGFVIRKKLLMVFIGILLCGCFYAQEKTVKGMIRTFDEIPVENVLILVKSSDQKFYSDSLGAFTVQCSQTDLLTFLAEGFIKEKIRIKKETKYAVINLKLKPGEEARELAIGYGHVKDKNNLYAISARNDGEMDFSRYRNIYEILETNFPGLQILNGDVIIRNTSTFNDTNPAALLIIDGRETNKDVFGNLSTSDIARINVMKDASTAVYGSRGGNGAVIVETKRGGK
jgi:TonB-dependent SusC/RagA subfamily outer membrane receptor